ncbi:MAG: zinc ribbon domain-containing protein [Clostridia bacterium]|nr:zinc ribbon domain-containing protein [Clostridia bacterium]
MGKMIKCNVCGNEIAKNAKVCPSCGAKNRNLASVRVAIIVVLVLTFIALIGIIASSDEESVYENTVQTVSGIDSLYSGDCGIEASASMNESIIGLPELQVSVKNVTDKDIKAVKFYAVPVDVYGEELTGWTTQDYLYTDDTITAGGTTSITYQFIEDRVKNVKLYVYSVYFADGSEWGNKDATKDVILKNGRLIEVN